MTGFLFALLSALCFGISNAYWRFAEKEDDFSRIVFFRGLIIAPVFGLAWWLSSRYGYLPGLMSSTNPNLVHYLLSFLICLLCSFGLLFFLLSLRYNPVGLSTVLSSVNIFSVLTATLVIGETFHRGYLIGFTLAAAGILLCKAELRFEKGWNKGLMYSLAASFCWGAGYALFRYPANWLGALPLSFLLESTVTIVALCWNLFTASPQRRINSRPASSQYKHYFILALLLLGGTLCFNIAIRNTAVLTLNLTGNISFVTALLLGWYWHKEKIGGRQVAGILLILASLLVVQLIN